jgi:hypothetical protein
VAQLGSAAALGAEGCGFKSCHPDSIYPCDVIGKHRPFRSGVLQVQALSGVYALVVQLVDTLGRDLSFLQVQILSRA